MGDNFSNVIMVTNKRIEDYHILIAECLTVGIVIPLTICKEKQRVIIHSDFLLQKKN